MHHTSHDSFIKRDDEFTLSERQQWPVDLRRCSFRVVALAVAVALPLFGATVVASAKVKAGCHKTHSCKASGGGRGTGGAPAPITVQIDPNPLVETGQSYVAATIQVETSPWFAGDPVSISSSQLQAACGGWIEFYSTADGVHDFNPHNHIEVILDDDGNATVLVVGYDCAPGPSVIEADLNQAPYYTALATLDAEPPTVTAPGVTGYPITSGTAAGGEVETGDTPLSGDSDVYAVFYVETDPVYAEKPVEISSPELIDRCGGGALWSSITPTGITPVTPQASSNLDDDGNAAFVFFGVSCAAGPSTVVADVGAGTHPTYTTTFNVLPPQPTI